MIQVHSPTLFFLAGGVSGIGRGVFGVWGAPCPGPFPHGGIPPCVLPVLESCEILFSPSWISLALFDCEDYMSYGVVWDE